MVFFFTSQEGYVMYMGRDKYENEDLIKYGLPEDVWFHVDDLSSAHVYLRMRPGQTLEDISQDTVMECAQLVKANSIEGCKKKDVEVVYTRWKNLRKTADMEIGQIGFNDKSRVRKIRVEKDNAIVNRLNRTKEERNPDLAEIQRERDAELRRDLRAAKKEQIAQENQAKKDREEAAKMKSYASFMKEDKMKGLTKYGSSTDDSAARRMEEDFL